MLLEQYRDLKWHLRQSSAFKIFSLREGWSFQTRKTEHSCECGGALPTAPGGAAAAGERGGGPLHRHQLPTLGCEPAEQPPRAECGGPEERTWRTKWSPARVNALAGCPTQGPDPLHRISAQGPWRAQGSRPAASPAHWLPPAPLLGTGSPSSYSHPSPSSCAHSASPWEQPPTTSLHSPQAFRFCRTWAYHPLRSTF